MSDSELSIQSIRRRVRDLESELSHVEDRRDQILTELRGLRIVLSAHTSDEQSHDNFAQAVRDMLRTFKRPARSKDVADALWEAGIRNKPRGSLVMAVAAELSRASKREGSSIRRLSRGMYEYRRD